MNLQDYLNRISPALFGLVIICFCLPFTTVSCQSVNFVTLSGYQLAMGTQLKDTTGLISSGFEAERWSQYAESLKSLDKKYAKQRRDQRRKQTNDEQRQKQEAAAKVVREYQIQGNPIAALIVGIVCAGMAVGFSSLRQCAQIELALAGLGIVLMVLLKVTTDGTVSREGHGLFRADYGEGYWLSLILLFGALGLNGYRYWQQLQDRA